MSSVPSVRGVFDVLLCGDLCYLESLYSLKKTTPLLTLVCEINNSEYDALIDSGASSNYMRSNELHEVWAKRLILFSFWDGFWP